MNKLSYKDGIFFNSLCECIVAGLEENKDLSIMLDRLKKYILDIERKVNGYWSLPYSRKVLLEALNSIILIMSNNCNATDIKAINYEFTRVLNSVNNKCKVTFLVQEYSIWASLQNIYDTMISDSRFEVKVVYVPFHHPNAICEDNNIGLYEKDGINVINFENYNLSEDYPDIVFFAKPYNLIPLQFYITEIEKIIDHTVYVPYGMEATFKLLRYGFQEYLHYRVWRHIVYGEYVKNVGKKFGYRNGENIVVWGHPKMDYFIKCRKMDIPKEWKEKINGRRVVCWCPHHTILAGPEHMSTWLDYFHIIFEWFEKHPEMVLLWRPHPLLFGAIVNNGYMTRKELETFLDRKKSSNNIIFDENEDYHPAFECSDAMISDGTTFSVEYLGTGKPLMLTIDDIDSYYNYKEAQRALYIGNSNESVIEFLENIRIGIDNKKELRKEYASKTIFYPKEQTISEYIADNLLKDLISENVNLARRLCR